MATITPEFKTFTKRKVLRYDIQNICSHGRRRREIRFVATCCPTFPIEAETYAIALTGGLTS